MKTGREWSDTAASPGTPRVARGWGCSKEGSLLEPSEGSWASRPLDFGLLASRAVTITFCCELPCLWAQDTSTAGKLGSDRAEGREGCLGGGEGHAWGMISKDPLVLPWRTKGEGDKSRRKLSPLLFKKHNSMHESMPLKNFCFFN